MYTTSLNLSVVFLILIPVLSTPSLTRFLRSFSCSFAMPYIGALHGKWRTLAKFSITPNGFLPARPPLQRLPSPYYAPWETLVQDLSRHLQDKTLRSRVHELPLIPVDHLAIEAEWRRAYLILTFLANGYVWGGDHAAEVGQFHLATPRCNHANKFVDISALRFSPLK